MGKLDLIVSKPEKRTIEQLRRLQELPLNQKIALSLRRIDQFCREMGNRVYISDSKGKDSQVLKHLVRRVLPTAVTVFINTGVEYPGIVEFYKRDKELIILKPKMSFASVIKKYGFPMVSKENAQKIYEIRTTKSEKLKNIRLYGSEKGHGKLPLKWRYLLDEDVKISHKCCDILKKNPAKKFERETGLHPFIRTMTEESRLRETSWLQTGCNAFNSKRPKSLPLSFWTFQDIWDYIDSYNLEYSSDYDNGEERTGCMFCLFGCQFDDADGARRFDRMEVKYPLHYKAAERWGIIDALNLIKPKDRK